MSFVIQILIKSLQDLKSRAKRTFRYFLNKVVAMRLLMSLFMLSCNLYNSHVSFIFYKFYDLAPQSACKEVSLVLDVKEEQSFRQGAVQFLTSEVVNSFCRTLKIFSFVYIKGFCILVLITSLLFADSLQYNCRLSFKYF